MLRDAAKEPSADLAKPVLLLVHYPNGSALAKADAQRLGTQAGASFQNSYLQAEAGAPAIAVIRFYEETDHALARVIGKSVESMGYRWRIEMSPTTPAVPRSGTIEVWLPYK